MTMRFQITNKGTKIKPEIVLTSPTSVGQYQAPRGFTTNMGSTPKDYFKKVGFTADTISIATVHDYLYKQKNKPRKTIDKWLLDSLKSSGVKFVTRWSIYWVCRLFGNKYWNNASRSLISRPKK